MKDFVENELSVGDKVVFMSNIENGLSRGIVTKLHIKSATVTPVGDHLPQWKKAPRLVRSNKIFKA